MPRSRMLVRTFKRYRFAFLFLWIDGSMLVWSAEPAYQGKSLSEWLMLYDRAEQRSPEEAQASAALRAKGSNAVPYLTKWIAESTSDVQLPSADAFKVLNTSAASAVPEL